ncbi:LysE family translocator [Kitasatospora sp. CM 4170]|uniref:LysE family translocator n=1 Tax=Kitasatospora sp. CM 4170 TaxID=3075627 RepID=UPI0028A9C779|nr:LysE family translocator [Kitasatospora sp. CM 4170]WNM43256.1 LysE family translocator [Kitasatospora sp. CM 4170]
MSSLAGFLLASLAVVAVPGSNLVHIVTRSAQDGRRAGLVTALGVETGTLLHVLAAVGGLAALVSDHPLAFTVLRYAGAGYLAYLGVRALGRRPAPDVGGAPGDDRSAGRRLFRVWGDAVLVNLLNPKVVLFFVAFLPQFVPAGLSAAATRARMLVLGVVFLALALALDLCYALLGAALTGRLRGTPRRERRLSCVTGGVHLGLAALVLV